MGNPMSGAVPVWVYIVLAVIGAALTGLFIFLHIRASRRPGPTQGDIGAPFAAAVMSFFVLFAAPLTLLAMQGAGGPDPRNAIIMVDFRAEGVNYQGEFRPTGGTGPMRVIYSDPETGLTRRVEQRCTMSGTSEMVIECTDARDFTGGSYRPDRFVVRFDGNVPSGSWTDPAGANREPATFRFVTSREPRFADAGFTTGAGASAATTTPAPSVPAPASADSGLAADLELAVQQLRQQLPIRSGPATVTAVEAVGTQLITYMSVAANLGPAQWSEIERGLRKNACQGSSLNLINSGASANYQLQDSAGEQRTIIISSCP